MKKKSPENPKEIDWNLHFDELKKAALSVWSVIQAVQFVSAENRDDLSQKLRNYLEKLHFLLSDRKSSEGSPFELPDSSETLDALILASENSNDWNLYQELFFNGWDIWEKLSHPEVFDFDRSDLQYADAQQDLDYQHRIELLAVKTKAIKAPPVDEELSEIESIARQLTGYQPAIFRYLASKRYGVSFQDFIDYREPGSQKPLTNSVEHQSITRTLRNLGKKLEPHGWEISIIANTIFAKKMRN
jgi:hypothetical protein